jgi:hypothetical protein
MSETRTHYAFNGVLYKVPEDVTIPWAYRQMINRGEIDLRELRQAEGF